MSAIKRVINCIRENKSFLITTHQSLEGDALGSEIAVYNLLKKLGKSAIIVNDDLTPQEYLFLKGTKKIMRYRKNMRLKFDVLVMLDCSNESRCGSVYSLAQAGQPILNVDHHISNTKFGHINWILPRASSAAEMVYQLYSAMRVEMDAHTAQALYVGILTDTGSFRYANTTSLTHQIAAQLLKFKLNIFQIYRNIYACISFSDMSLISKILSTLEMDASGKIITFQITKRLLRNKEIECDLSENILYFGRLVRGSEVCVLLKEQWDKAGYIRVNFRSQGKIDVNRVAQSFAGGGHKTASGCTIKGSVQTVKRKIIDKIKEQL